MVISSQWQQHAPAGEQGQGVTQLAAHSIADGKRSSALHADFCEEGAGAVAQSLSQFWRAGDVTSIWTTAGLPISMAEFDDRRTNGTQRGAAVSVHYPSGQGPDNLHYVEAISRYEPGLSFSSLCVNENAMQPGQEQFLVGNSCVGGSQTVPHSARREQRYKCEMRGEKIERQATFRPSNDRGRNSAVQSFGNEFRQHRDELGQEIGRIARELEGMRHVHATENCEGEAAGKVYVGEQSPALPARVPVHYSRKGRSKRHTSSTPRNKKGCDNLKLLFGEQSS